MAAADVDFMYEQTDIAPGVTLASGARSDPSRGGPDGGGSVTCDSAYDPPNPNGRCCNCS